MLIALRPELLLQRQHARLKEAADGAFTLTDGLGKVRQTVAFHHPDIQRALLRLRIQLRPTSPGGADFCLLYDGGKLLARVMPDGVLQAPPARTCSKPVARRTPPTPSP